MRPLEDDFELLLEDTLAKALSVIPQHSNPCVAYSGGSDSDTMMFLLRQAGFDIPAVLHNTGIEWAATLRHTDYMRSLGFTIDTTRATKSVPTSNRVYGHPWINKRASGMLQRLQKHDFQFQKHGHLPFAVLYQIYPRCKAALRWWCNDWGEGSRFNIANNSYLKEFLIEFGLPFQVSDQCCEWSKKQPGDVYAREHDVDLMIMGLRKSEGGVRVGVFKNCYSKQRKDRYYTYRPLWFWNNAMKQWYKEKHNISYSDCYEVYGLQRTGCAACPFALGFEDELDLLHTYEPKLHKGIVNIFEPSYKWTRKYRAYQRQQREATAR